MRVPHAEQRPRSQSQLASGMFSYQAIAWPQEGQRERGVDSVIRGASGTGRPSSSALSSRQPRSSISGRRWTTTLRKLPMHRPRTARSAGE
jgi:hypothetical protein